MLGSDISHGYFRGVLGGRVTPCEGALEIKIDPGSFFKFAMPEHPWENVPTSL